MSDVVSTKKEYIESTKLLNKKGVQFRIIEYPLIILFVITGATFLIANTNLLSAIGIDRYIIPLNIIYEIFILEYITPLNIIYDSFILLCITPVTIIISGISFAEYIIIILELIMPVINTWLSLLILYLSLKIVYL
jgi:NADH-ubiquinone oxidoreductase chain 2